MSLILLPVKPWQRRLLRLFALAVVSLVLTGCEGLSPSKPDRGGRNFRTFSGDRLFSPGMPLAGARLAAPSGKIGGLSVQPETGTFTRFVYPTAVAARGPDVYVVDSGLGAVFRLDLTRNEMTALAGAPSHIGTKIYVMGDLSVYVLDQAGRRVLHFSRSGQLIQTLGDNLNLGRPVDVVVDEIRGLVLVGDGLYNQVVAFHLAGRASYPIVPRRQGENALQNVTAIAGGREGVYVADRVCGCIHLLSAEGKELEVFGKNSIFQPESIAVDRYNRVFVSDRFDNSVKTFSGGSLIAKTAAGEIGVQQVGNLWVDESLVYVADSLGAQVQILHLLPPGSK